jgi:hypothetical protein
MGLVTILSFVVALVFAYGAGLLLIIDCNEESYSTCSKGGYGQLALALVGFGFALCGLIAAVTSRWRPGLWVCAAAATFTVWLVVAFAVGETG